MGRGAQAIAAAVLHDLVARARPLLLFSTHHHALADGLRGAGGRRRRVGLRHMACEVDAARRRLTFLYRFRAGVAGHSHGLHCARAAGLPAAVVARAEARAEALERRGDHLAARRAALFAAVAGCCAAGTGAGGRPSAAAAEQLAALQADVRSALR